LPKFSSEGIFPLKAFEERSLLIR